MVVMRAAVDRASVGDLVLVGCTRVVAPRVRRRRALTPLAPLHLVCQQASGCSLESFLSLVLLLVQLGGFLADLVFILLHVLVSRSFHEIVVVFVLLLVLLCSCILQRLAVLVLDDVRKRPRPPRGNIRCLRAPS